MGYWIHVEDVPSGGGGETPNFGCIGCLACAALVVVPAFLWYLHKEYGLAYVMISFIAQALMVGSILSMIGILYVLIKVRFERAVILSGVVGFVAGAILFFVIGFGFPLSPLYAPIGAIAAMCLYVRFF